MGEHTTSTAPREPQERQRAELTFKANAGRGRHGWLRLTPAYSVKVVDALLEEAPEGAAVLDPFSGTATTPLCASVRGLDAVSLDINPFLVWLGNLKLRRYKDSTIGAAANAALRCTHRTEPSLFESAAPPPIYRIDRWWGPEALAFLCELKAAIQREGGRGRAASNLLSVAFCRTMIALSNAAFNHQSMSFKEGGPVPDDARRVWLAQFEMDVATVLASAADNPAARGRTLFGDARTLAALEERRFDLVITSPPYPNRMSYVRELRPYMYWMGFLRRARDAGELDWEAIGGTWGVATSRLKDWKRPTSGWVRPRYFEQVLRKVERGHDKNGPLLAKYIDKYFHDMHRHLEAVRARVNAGGAVHYVVGNSTFYGVLLPVERLYRDMLRDVGFTKVGIERLRKRNSKKELYEFRVFGRAPG